MSKKKQSTSNVVETNIADRPSQRYGVSITIASTSSVVETNIADITVGERFRKKFINIDSLADSINRIGLDYPIVLNEKKELVSGGRRLEAFKLLEKTTIPARIINIDQTLDHEIDENNQREPFTVSEKVAIAAELSERIGERRGNPTQAVEINTDTNPVNSPELGEETRTFVAKRAGFGSASSYRQAKTVLEKAIPEVVDAMDSGIVSINFAHTVAQASKKKQLTLLNEAKSDPETDASALDASNKLRRTMKRTTKAQKPVQKTKNQIYSIVRLAPDWWNDVMSDIEETPIRDFLDPDCGVLVIECPNLFLSNAFALLANWELSYSAAITAYYRKATEGEHIDYINKPCSHLVIARINKDLDAGFSWVDPVFDRQELGDAMDEIISAIWPEEGITKLDMSSIDPRSGWDVWKVDYADGVKQGPEETDPEEAE